MGRQLNLKWLKGVDREADPSRRRILIVAAGVVALVVLAILVEPFVPFPDLSTDFSDEPLPDFKAIGDVGERKQAFFEFLAPMVEDVNRRLLEERSKVIELQDYFQKKGKLSEGRLEDLNELLVAYKFEPVEKPSSETFGNLLSRVDIIPPSLALAQAAVESGWGTSRFAREGNNLFGMWCYEPGCGIVPARRSAGATHEVTKYDSPRDSFEDYIRNLNTNQAYVALRAIRRELRAAGATVNGTDLARGLVKYSTQRWEYVGKIQTMIGSNDLERFDREKET